jgi:hypothetical protein
MNQPVIRNLENYLFKKPRIRASPKHIRNKNVVYYTPGSRNLNDSSTALLFFQRKFYCHAQVFILEWFDNEPVGVC